MTVLQSPEILSATCTTQNPGDNSPKVANTEYVDTAVGALQGGNGIDITSGTISADINTTNLKFTSSKIDTIQPINTAAAITFRSLNLGVDDTTAGVANIYGNSTTTPGALNLFNGASSDGTVNSWQLRPAATVFELLPSTDTVSSFIFARNSDTDYVTLVGQNNTARGSGFFYGDDDVSGGRGRFYNGANADSTFDYFNVEANGTALDFSTNVSIMASLDNYQFFLGVNDDTRGVFGAFGDTIDLGGEFRWYNAANQDSNNNFFRARSNLANLEFGDSGTASMILYGGGAEGMAMGSPTGGNQGAGTINVSGDLFKDGTAFTNPDFVLEHYYTGQIVRFINNPGAKQYKGILSIDDMMKYTKKHYKLPGMPSTKVMGVFGRADFLLSKVEESHMYIGELHHRVNKLEEKKCLCN